MKDEKYDIAFKMIADAGDSRADSIYAIQEAQKGNIEIAKNLLLSAKKKMQNSHKFQFDLITAEANGNSIEINILLIHAEDHLSMATIMIDVASAFITNAEQIVELKERCEYLK